MQKKKILFIFFLININQNRFDYTNKFFKSNQNFNLYIQN